MNPCSAAGSTASDARASGDTKPVPAALDNFAKRADRDALTFADQVRVPFEKPYR